MNNQEHNLQRFEPVRYENGRAMLLVEIRQTQVFATTDRIDQYDSLR